MTKPVVLLTGATGFVGRHVAIALEASGWHVRATSRYPDEGRRAAPHLDWIQCDLESHRSLRQALSGASAAVYLYHAIGSSRDYDRREAAAARGFKQAADDAGLTRIVYLGGVVPTGPLSRHLESRRVTGELLRQGRGVTIELRASMIIGHPSASFGLIRDLSVRLPLLILPPWLDHDSCPIAICDVASAIALATIVPFRESAWFELPGPERVSHRTLLGYLAGPLGTHIVESRVGAITPALASVALAVLSKVRPSLSSELVSGLKGPLAPSGPDFWSLVGTPPLRPLRHAIVDAICDENAQRSPSEETTRRIATKTQNWLASSGVVAHA